MGIGTPGSYTSGSDTYVVKTILDDSSNNDHTLPRLIWSKDGIVYAAVKSTHNLDYMKLGGESINDSGVTSNDKDKYNAGVFINVDDTGYDPKYELTSATQKAHWTVFKFTLSDLTIPADGSLAFFVKGIGGGHDVGGFLLVEVPKISITGEKNGLVDHSHI